MKNQKDKNDNIKSDKNYPIKLYVTFGFVLRPLIVRMIYPKNVYTCIYIR